MQLENAEASSTRGCRRTQRLIQTCSRGRSRSHSRHQHLNLSTSTISDGEPLKPMPFLMDISKVVAKLVRQEKFLCRDSEVPALWTKLESRINPLMHAIDALVTWEDE